MSKKRVPVRKLLSVVAGAALLVTVSACSAPPPSGFTGCDTGESAALVTAVGALGSDIDVTFPTPLVPASSENSVPIAGDGQAVSSADAANITLSVFDAATGDPIIEPTVIVTFVDGRFPFTSALTCANEGGRVITTGTTESLLADGVTGIEPDRNVVIVTDINASFPGRATGADRAPQAGFPAVVLAPNGQPGFTTPATAPPSALKFATLKQGSGARVTEGDTILVNLTGIGWGAKATFLSSWDIGGPSRVIASDMTMIERGVPAGLAEAIIGQKVGSQIIAVVPPALGYPAGSAPEGVTPTSTVVFLVDILRID